MRGTEADEAVAVVRIPLVGARVSSDLLNPEAVVRPRRSAGRRPACVASGATQGTGVSGTLIDPGRRQWARGGTADEVNSTALANTEKRRSGQ